MSDGALSIAVAALQQIAQLGSQERDRVTAQAALDCVDALGEHRPDQPQQTMYEVIWGWLAANNPAALELCPYKAKAS